MSHRPACSEVSATSPQVTETAQRLLTRIRAELLELDADFGLDSDLFNAGLDSMAIMQVILIVEEEFGATLPDCSIKRETFSTARRIAEAIHLGRL
jgi:acyl carrier protein